MVGSLIVPGSQNHHLRDTRLMKALKLLNLDLTEMKIYAKMTAYKTIILDMNSFEKWRLLGCRQGRMNN